MNAETFLENFSHIANANDGINRLRRMIHDLAFHGLLVSQSKNESALEFLQLLTAEKDELMRSGLAKRSTPTEDRPPLYVVPNNWEWSNLEQLSVNIHYGVTTKAIHGREGVRMLRITDIQNDRVDWESVPGCEIDAKQLESASLSDGDLLIARTGGTIGKTYLVENLSVRAVFASYLIRLIPLPSLYSQFIKLFTLSSVYWQQLLDASSGTGQPNVNATALKGLQIPLPPLEEQTRIVSKVDELMKLCDELEGHQQARHRLFPLLSQSSHARLAAHPTPTNLAAIFTDPPTLSPDDMRKTILSLAVRGKLVIQCSADEPADDQVRRVKKIKTQLTVSKVIKHDNAIQELTTEDVPFEIPESWMWVRAGDVCHPISSGTTPSKDVFHPTDGIPYLKVYNIRQQEIDFKYKPQFIDPKHHSSRMKRSILRPGDVVLNIVGPPLGKTAIIPDSFPEWNCNQAIAFFQPIIPEMAGYIYIYLKEGGFLKDIILIGTAGQDNISVTKCKNIPIPLPPLQEQKRIINRVHQFMALVDELEANQTQASEIAALFVQSAVASITGTEIKEQQVMKAPKTELVTSLIAEGKRTKADNAPLATILAKSKSEVSAKELWQKSGLEIDAFYSQLKTEMNNGWIAEPNKGFMKEVESN